MILLDTNVLSELMKRVPDKKVVATVNKYSAESSHISAITQAEILQGIAVLAEGKRKQKLAETAGDILKLFNENILAFDKNSSSFYADIIQQRQQNGLPIDFPDAQIAAIALQHNLKLLTRNVKDFEGIDGLTIMNPWT